MPFKMDKRETKQYDDLSSAVRDATEAMEEARETFNEAVLTAYADLETAYRTAENAVADLREFAEQFHADQLSEFEEKSEKWQESDKGQEVAAWISAWEEFATSLELPAIEAPEALDIEVEFDIENGPAGDVN
jgi:glutamyl-tRNA reductase